MTKLITSIICSTCLITSSLAQVTVSPINVSPFGSSVISATNLSSQPVALGKGQPNLVPGFAGAYNFGLVTNVPPTGFTGEVDPGICRFGSKYYIYSTTFVDAAGPNVEHASINCYSSLDGTNWSREGMVIGPATTNSFNNSFTNWYSAFPWVENGTIYLYLAGITNLSTSDWNIYLFTSTDATNFTYQGKKLDRLTGASWESSQVYVPAITKVGSTYVMFYNAGTPGYNFAGRATASSISGPWTRFDTNGPGIATTNYWKGYTSIERISPIQFGDVWYFFFDNITGGSAIGNYLWATNPLTGPFNMADFSFDGTNSIYHSLGDPSCCYTTNGDLLMAYMPYSPISNDRGRFIGTALMTPRMVTWNGQADFKVPSAASDWIRVLDIPVMGMDNAVLRANIWLHAVPDPDAPQGPDYYEFTISTHPNDPAPTITFSALDYWYDDALGQLTSSLRVVKNSTGSTNTIGVEVLAANQIEYWVRMKLNGNVPANAQKPRRVTNVSGGTTNVTWTPIRPSDESVLVADNTGNNILWRPRVLDGTNIQTGTVSMSRLPGVTNFTTYASGTAYTLTGTSAALDFGTTDPTLIINQAGTYLIQGNVGIKYTGATYAGAQTATMKFRRTNNTATDLSNGSRTVEMPVLTTFTGGDVFSMPPIIYTATSGDIITIFGILSATPAAGSVVTDSAEIVAIRLY